MASEQRPPTVPFGVYGAPVGDRVFQNIDVLKQPSARPPRPVVRAPPPPPGPFEPHMPSPSNRPPKQKVKMKPTTKPRSRPKGAANGPPIPKVPETTFVSRIPTPKSALSVELRSYPEFRPEKLPPLQALTLAPVHDSTAYIIESYTLPAARVSPIDGRLLPKELVFLVGWTDLPAARVVVPLTQVMDYVSPFKYEEWEQEQERKREAVRQEVLAAAAAADEELEKEMLAAAAEGAKQPKKKGRPPKKRVGEQVGATLMAGSLLAPEELPIQDEDSDEDMDELAPLSAGQGPSLSPPKRRMMAIELDSPKRGTGTEEGLQRNPMGHAPGLRLGGDSGLQEYHEVGRLAHEGLGAASRQRSSSLLKPPAPNSVASSVYLSDSDPRSSSMTPKVGSPPGLLAARLREERLQQPSGLRNAIGPSSSEADGPGFGGLLGERKRKRSHDSSAARFHQTTFNSHGVFSTADSPPSDKKPPHSLFHPQQPQSQTQPQPLLPQTTSPRLPVPAPVPDPAATPTAHPSKDDDQDELGQDEYVVERVERMSLRPYHGRPRRYYLIYWEGFDEPTWEPEVNMPKSLIDAFYADNPHVEDMRRKRVAKTPSMAVAAAQRGAVKGSGAGGAGRPSSDAPGPGGFTTPLAGQNNFGEASGRKDTGSKSAGRTGGGGGSSKGGSKGGKQMTLQWPLATTRKFTSVLDVMEHEESGGEAGDDGRLAGGGEYDDDDDHDELLVVG